MAEPVTSITQKWDITYTHATGETVGRFLTELRDRKIMGRRCPSCRRVLVPPRSFCDICYAATTDWVEVGNEGIIEAFTITYASFKGYPEPPYALAYVRLDKADTAILGYVRNVDLTDVGKAANKLWIGTKVKLAFKDTPEGRVTDFWFVPA